MGYGRAGDNIVRPRIRPRGCISVMSQHPEGYCGLPVWRAQPEQTAALSIQHKP